MLISGHPNASWGQAVAYPPGVGVVEWTSLCYEMLYAAAFPHHHPDSNSKIKVALDSFTTWCADIRTMTVLLQSMVDKVGTLALLSPYISLNPFYEAPRCQGGLSSFCLSTIGPEAALSTLTLSCPRS